MQRTGGFFNAMKVKRYQIQIKLDLQLPTSLEVIDCGNFSKGFCVLICALHGDERSSILIVNQLLNNVKNQQLDGGIRIILNANPLGFLLNQKAEPLSGFNLNRCFKPNFIKTNNPTAELVQEIIKLCTGAKFCIDLHDMPGSSLPISSILTITGNPKVEQQNRDLISRFGPQVAWIENFNKAEMAKRYTGTINSYLNSINIANFTIETSGIETFSISEAKKIASKITDLSNSKSNKEQVVYVERLELYSPVDGIVTFSPIPLLQKVVINTQLVSIFNRETTVFKSPSNGLLIRKVNQKFVKKGEKIFDLGVKI